METTVVRLTILPILLGVLCLSSANAAVMTGVSTLDHGTGLPIPGSGDNDTGVTSAASFDDGVVTGASWSGGATGNYGSYTVGAMVVQGFEFRVASGASNLPGTAGVDSLEVMADVLWTDTITGVVGDLVLLPEVINLVFKVDGSVFIDDKSNPQGAGGTVAWDFQASAFDASGELGSAVIAADNQFNDGTVDYQEVLGVTGFSHNDNGLSSVFSFTWATSVNRDVPFEIGFRSLSLAGFDGMVLADLSNTIFLVDVTDVTGAISYNDVIFADSGTTFASSSVSAPASALLLAPGLVAGWRSLRRKTTRAG